MTGLRRADLRDCVSRLYQANGSVVREIRRRGIVPGSLLDVSGRTIAVRTSLDRDFSITRRSDGSPATISSADEVVVITPCPHDPSLLEVYAFDPAVIVERFWQSVAAQKAQYPAIGEKGPVFIGLDGAEEDKERLSTKARWKKLVSAEPTPLRSKSAKETLDQFRRRVHREFAHVVGLSENEVAVELRIVPLRPSAKSESEGFN
jgi:hypothetical protein